jgi:hypothetical protein
MYHWSDDICLTNSCSYTSFLRLGFFPPALDPIVAPAVLLPWPGSAEHWRCSCPMPFLPIMGDDHVSPIMLFVMKGCACAPFMMCRCVSVLWEWVLLSPHEPSRMDGQSKAGRLKLNQRNESFRLESHQLMMSLQLELFENHSLGKSMKLQYSTNTGLCSK